MKYFESFWHSLSILTDNEHYSERPVTYTWRALLWYLLVAMKKNPTARIKEWQTTFVLPCVWRTPAKLFFVFRRDYESEVHFFENAIQPGDCVIDIGANFGLYTVLAAKKAGSAGKVLAFEPFPASTEILLRNCELNNLGSVVKTFPCALGEEQSTASMAIHSDPGRNRIGSLGAAEVARVDVRVDTLDNIVKESECSRIDFIKMDVEGFEAHVLRGARETLSRLKPVIAFELNPEACRLNGEDAADIIHVLENTGYYLFEYLGGRKLKRVAPKAFGNYIAIHRDRLQDAHFADWELGCEPI